MSFFSLVHFHFFLSCFCLLFCFLIHSSSSSSSSLLLPSCSFTHIVSLFDTPVLSLSLSLPICFLQLLPFLSFLLFFIFCIHSPSSPSSSFFSLSLFIVLFFPFTPVPLFTFHFMVYCLPFPFTFHV